VRVAAGTKTPDESFSYVGEPLDDTTFSYVCALDPGDDPLEDPTCWPKANPLLGVTITEEYLSDVVRQAKALPGKLNGILRLHFCTWTDSDEAWMSRAALESVLDDFDPAEHIGRPMYAGLDLSATRDLTASAYVVETGYTDVTRPDGTVATLPTYDAWVDAWTPADTLTQRALSDDAPYDVWVEQGWLISVPGPIVRYDYVAAHLAGMIAEGYDIQALAYDSYAFQRLFLPELDAAGVTVPVVSHPQGGKRKSAGSDLWMPGSKRTLESLILEGRIRLRRSPVLISAMMSAAIEPDPLDNTSFSKQRAVNRIDALIALTMAVGLATSGDVMDGPSIYDRMTDAQAAFFGLQSTAPAVQTPVDGARISATDRQILADPHHPGWQAARERYDMALAAADEEEW
jgi:phage terminase large subunit-like protein